MDFASITAALSSIKTASDIARIIKDSGASLEAAETKMKLAELISALADSKIEIANIKEILLTKDAEIQALKDQLEMKNKVVWEEPYYFLITDTDKKDGPYCQKCYDTDKKLIRLQSLNRGIWKCEACQNTFRDKSYQPAVGARANSAYNIFNK